MKSMSMKVLRRPRRVLACAAAACLCLGQALSARAGVQLSRVGVTLLKKNSGRVDQVVVVPDGGYILRDSDYANEATQVLELYDAYGYLCGQFGSFGRGPGQYFRLKSVSLSDDQTVFVADVIGRLSRFHMSGRLIETKLIQRPGYQVDGLALDEVRGAFYLSGCLPKQIYLNYGCRLVHQYDLKDGSYRQSFLETDQEVSEKNLLSLEDHQIDADGRGRIYAIDAPIFKVLRLDPATGEVRTLVIQSRLAAAPQVIPPGLQNSRDAYENAYLLDRVLAAGGWVIVSMRKPRKEGFLLHVFDGEGKQVASDLQSPGQLVGKTPGGALLFATRTDGGYELAEYTLSGGGRGH
jgi:hypothetical protein